MVMRDLISDLWGRWNEMVSVKPGLLKEPKKHKHSYPVPSWVLPLPIPQKVKAHHLKQKAPGQENITAAGNHSL